MMLVDAYCRATVAGAQAERDGAPAPPWTALGTRRNSPQPRSQAPALVQDALERIFAHLNPSDLRQARCVNRHWRDVATRPWVVQASIKNLQARHTWANFEAARPGTIGPSSGHDAFWQNTARRLVTHEQVDWRPRLPFAYAEPDATSALAPLWLAREGPVWAMVYMDQRSDGPRVGPERTCGLFVCNLATGASKTISHVAYSLEFNSITLSPDGRWLAFRPSKSHGPDQSGSDTLIGLQFLPDLGREVQVLGAPLSSSRPRVMAMTFDSTGLALLVCDGTYIWPVAAKESSFADDDGAKKSWAVMSALSRVGTPDLALALYARQNRCMLQKLPSQDGYLLHDTKENFACVLPRLRVKDGQSWPRLTAPELVRQSLGAYALPRYDRPTTWAVSQDGSTLMAWYKDQHRWAITKMRKQPGADTFVEHLFGFVDAPQPFWNPAGLPVILRSLVLSADGEQIFGVFNTGQLFCLDRAMQMFSGHGDTMSRKRAHEIPQDALHLFNNTVCLTAFDRSRQRLTTYRLQSTQEDFLPMPWYKRWPRLLHTVLCPNASID